MRLTRKEFLALGTSAAAGAFFGGGRRTAASGGMPAEATNALEHQTYDMYQEWFSWLRGAGTPGFLGEHNTPNDQKPWPAEEVEKWLSLLDKVYQLLDYEGLAAVTAHTASPTVSGGNGLKVYGPARGDVPLSERTLTKAFEQAQVVEKYPSTSTYLRGVNANGGEFRQSGFSSSSPGNYGSDYIYPNRTDFDFLRRKGHVLVRIPFRWERVQPNLQEALSTEEMQRLKASVNAAGADGLKVILDVHNYANYILSTTWWGGFDNGSIGSSKVPISAFADLWSRLADQFAGDSAVTGYDIMNEPYSMPGGASQWETASQAAVDAIRSRDPSTTIWVPGYHQRDGYHNGLFCFVANHPRPWITGTGVGYTSHCYYGPGPEYTNTYDEAVAYWAQRGYYGGSRNC